MAPSFFFFLSFSPLRRHFFLRKREEMCRSWYGRIVRLLPLPPFFLVMFYRGCVRIPPFVAEVSLFSALVAFFSLPEIFRPSFSKPPSKEDVPPYRFSFPPFFSNLANSGCSPDSSSLLILRSPGKEVLSSHMWEVRPVALPSMESPRPCVLPFPRLVLSRIHLLFTRAF